MWTGSYWWGPPFKRCSEAGCGERPFKGSGGDYQWLPGPPQCKGVLVDEREGVERCVEMLHSKGHEKLAFVLPNHTPSNLSKQQGFIQGMEKKKDGKGRGCGFMNAYHP